MARTAFATLLSLGCLILAPAQAAAQYKNTAFGFDAGFWLIQKPEITDEARRNANLRPLRLSAGGRFGGETNFKLDQDHWWFTGRVNVAFLQFAGEDDFDQAAREALGTLMGVQGSIGIRYVILTDKFRPYLQLALSYLRLFSFTEAAGADCADVICDSGTYASNYLPHPNVGGVHLQPGFEVIIGRDLALQFFADVQHWIVLGAADNNSVVLGIGILFFT